jgi:hypothetical protein
MVFNSLVWLIQCNDPWDPHVQWQLYKDHGSTKSMYQKIFW